MINDTSCGPVAIIGAGDHAAVVAGTMLQTGFQIDGFYADDLPKIGTETLGFPVKGNIASLDPAEIRYGVIAIGSNEARKALSESLALNWVTVIHPSVILLPDSEVGPGTVVLAGSVLDVGCRVGSHTIINAMSGIGHHCHIGDYVHIGQAAVSSNTHIGQGAFIGQSSTILPRVSVGEWATVGAGALVNKDVPPGDTVVGLPAKSIAERSTRLS